MWILFLKASVVVVVLVSGGVVDFDKARRIILQDYRNTKLGTITLDKVDEEPYYPENGEDTQNG